MSTVLTLAFGWEPEIRGITVVLIIFLVLCGSVYLLLATNLGARLGMLVALAGFFGWMTIMGAIWWVYGIGYQGSLPSWRPVEVIVPEGCLLAAEYPSAVVAGNVETSSRVADLCLTAFGLAQGQGTMNNLTLGNDSFTYYETLGGGQAASSAADGPSAVHVAMSNTLNTPIEAMEIEFPLRAGEYSVRRGSGGGGEHRGGDGLVREIVATEPMSFALLTERRRHAPAGAGGGAPGRTGRNLLVRKDGSTVELEPKCAGTLEPGDGLRIETPGGGGHGG